MLQGESAGGCCLGPCAGALLPSMLGEALPGLPEPWTGAAGGHLAGCSHGGMWNKGLTGWGGEEGSSG